MREAGRPSSLPKPVTTPSAGVSLPFMAGEMLAWLARRPISWKLPGSKSRSTRSRTVSLPSACCLAMASAPPMASARPRRASSSSVSSFIPMGLSLDHDGPIGRDAGVRRRAARNGEHGRDLAPVMRAVIDHVLEERREGDLGLYPLVVRVGDRAREIARGETLHEGPLLTFQDIPRRPEVTHAGEVGVARHAGGRSPRPAGEPDPIRAVEMGEHALDGGEAPVLAHVARGDAVTEIDGDAEQPPVRPAVIVEELPHQLDAHVASWESRERLAPRLPVEEHHVGGRR